MTSNVLMPKATAVWLIENTSLAFKQIADFTGLHPLEVQAIADGESATGMMGFDPTANGQVTKEEIARCEADPTTRLKMQEHDRPEVVMRSKGPRYTPVTKRQDRPDAILWLLKTHPELQDSQIARLVGSTKSTVQSVRERTHWNSPNLKARDPVTMGLCSLADLNQEVDRAQRKAAREASARDKAKAQAAMVAAADLPPPAAGEAHDEDADEDDAEEAADETVDLSEADQPDTVDPSEADQPDVADPDDKAA